MPAGSLLALLDDIATILDDVAVMTKVAAKQTAGVLGDDLALNAQQLSGMQAERELPVVWAVAKGSFRNKLILVPAALLLSAFASWAVLPLLMIGGAYLCYEGFEKIAHRFLHSPAEEAAADAELVQAVLDPAVDLLVHEKTKIGGAVRTDFILSAEIIVIALGTVRQAEFATQAAVVSAIAVLMTVGVYGLVAGIIKLDDLGYRLLRASAAHAGARISRLIGSALLQIAPRLMKSLSVIGTAAMFMVGGGIVLHGVPQTAAALHHLEQALQTKLVWGGGFLSGLAVATSGAVAGIIVGAVALGCVVSGAALMRRLRK